MKKSDWHGIPRRYWPKKGWPWRVTWGLGCFRDFRNKRDAIIFYKANKNRLEMISEPFNLTGGNRG